MTVNSFKWRIGSFDKGARIPPLAFSASLLICTVVWLAGAGGCYATSASGSDWTATPIFWTLILLVTPSICFSIGVGLVNSRRHARLTCFDWCALVAAFFPVTLGSFVAVWAVKALFWGSFQAASIVLRIAGALITLALFSIAGTMMWKTARNYMSGKRPEERPAAQQPV